MTGLKAVSAILFVALASTGSTCRQQSSGGGEAAMDTPAAQADVTMPGVDTSALTPREKKEWSTYVSELLAPCADVPVSIAQCVQEKRNCSKCLPAAKYVLKGVRDGMSREQIEKSYHNRFDADRIKNVPIDGSPTTGPSDAPVTVVEFADFECPFCAMEAPILEKMLDTHKGQVRFVYKFFPLQAHPHGEIAARAAIAAGDQGKFWEMHHKLFANRDHLEQTDLDAYAKELGLDLKKFREDMNAQATTDRIARDKKLAETLGVQGTPTIYINGREFDVHQNLDEWLALEGVPETKGASTTSGEAPQEKTPADAGAAGAEKRAANAPDAGKNAGKSAGKNK